MRMSGRSTEYEIDEFESSSDPVKRISKVFRVIYQVRCNLEHGDKLPSNHRDVKLVASSLPIVKSILEFALSQHEMSQG
jgi:hypothetical protein